MTNARRIDDHVLSEINITPFTDVLLVLLIIFMILAALDVPPGFQKQFAPPSHPVGRIVLRHQIEIDVSRTNRVTIDGVPASSANLYASVAAAVRAHERRQGYSTHVALLADKDSSYDTIVKVLDAARQAGDEDVGFVTY